MPDDTLFERIFVSRCFPVGSRLNCEDYKKINKAMTSRNKANFRLHQTMGFALLLQARKPQMLFVVGRLRTTPHIA